MGEPRPDYLLDMVVEMAELARIEGRHRIADQLDDTATQIRHEISRPPSPTRGKPEALAIAKELDKLSARASQHDLDFAAKLIEMAAAALRPLHY